MAHGQIRNETSGVGIGRWHISFLTSVRRRKDRFELLLPLFVLLWPGEFVGMAIGSWNTRPLTVFLSILTNVTLYASLIYVILTKLDNRKQAKRNAE